MSPGNGRRGAPALAVAERSLGPEAATPVSTKFRPEARPSTVSGLSRRKRQQERALVAIQLATIPSTLDETTAKPYIKNDGNTMKTKLKTTKHDWRRFDAMSEDERHAAALAGPDAPPLTPERLRRMTRTPEVKVIRRALGLSQEEFAGRFQIPLGTLRDWEQGRKDPDAAA